MEKQSLLSSIQLGKLLSLSRRQVFRLNSSGKIPTPLKIGGSVRWSLGEITAWIEAGCPNREEWEQIKNNYDFKMEAGK